MKRTTLSLIIATILVTPSALFSQTWTDLGNDGVWSNAANWTLPASVPTTSGAVIFGPASFPDPDPVTHIVSVENSNNPVVIASLTANAIYDLTLNAAGTETLQVNGALTNLSSNVVDIALEYTFGSNSLNGPIVFSSLVNTATQNVSVTDAVSFTNNVYLTLTTNSNYGRYNLNAGAAINLTGASVKIDPTSTYAGAVGDTFQLFNVASGSWSGVTGTTLDVTSLPTLTTGQWSTTNFTTNGSISVVPVPEPTTWALLAGSLTTVMVFRRRRSQG